MKNNELPKSNQELIEKVRQCKAAIHNDQNKENKEKLRTLLSVIFPEDNPEMCYSNMEYYYASTDLKIWTCADDLPRGLEAIPLSAFFTNELPKSDLEIIAYINERLKKLEDNFAEFTDCYNKHLFMHKEPDVAPVDTKEGFGFCVKAEFSQVVKCSTQCEYCEQRERNLSQQGEQPNQIKEEVKERWQEKLVAAVIPNTNTGSKTYYIVVDSYFEDLTNEQARELSTQIESFLATL